jgi:cephalosporin-C deacetylase-like acetyl esterase
LNLNQKSFFFFEMALEVAKHIKSRFGHLFEDVCRFIIRPDRAAYTIDDLGPSLFRLGEGLPAKYKRTDLDLVNMRGMSIKCSWFEPYDPPSSPIPCVVYLHGNCGCRWDGLEILWLLKHGFSLFVYDACGSGHSDGEFVSLGFYERQDLATVIEYLHTQSPRVRSIGLWGRSMGAVTSIMYASKDDQSIQCLIGDSPFSSLKALCKDLVEQHGSWVPNSVVSAVVKRIRKRVSKMAGFDIYDLDCTKYAKHCDVPAFLFHGENDTFVRPLHSLAVESVYRGSCLHKIVSGDHNSKRGDDVMETAVAFLKLYLIDKMEAVELARAQRKQSGDEDARLQRRKQLDAADNEHVASATPTVLSASMPSDASGDEVGSPTTIGGATSTDDAVSTGATSADQRGDIDDDDEDDEELLERLTRATMLSQEGQMPAGGAPLHHT